MNKQVIFLSAGIMMSAAAFAQKDKLRDAKNNLETATTAAKASADLAAPAYTKAKEAIDLAVNNPDTKDKPETWLTKAGIYIGMQENPKLNADDPYKEGISALKKAMELNPKYNTDPQVIQLLVAGSFYDFNTGINQFNKGQYPLAYSTFKESADLLGPDKDKRFILTPMVDTIRAKAIMYAGRNAYYAGAAADGNAEMIGNAITNLSASKSSPYLEDDDKSVVYLNLAQAYEKKGDKANQTATINEGLKKYPNDQNLKNLDLNAAIQGGSQTEAIAKMEDAAAKDPKNAAYQMNLGILYYTVAYPSGGKSPADAAAYSAKAEAAYLKALAIEPENASYNFQIGSYYYNNASRAINEMNSLGTSKADQAKYDQLNKEKDEMFKKSLPYLEKARDLFNAKRTKLNKDEGKEFINTLTGLKEIYSRMDQPEKSAEAKKLLNEITE